RTGSNDPAAVRPRPPWGRTPRPGRPGPSPRTDVPRTARVSPARRNEMTPPDDRPLVALTLGDVAGVGPEVVARAWGDTPLRALARPFVVGSRSVLERALACVGGNAAVQEIARPEDARPTARLIPCLEATDVDVAGIAPGRVDPRAGQAAYDYLVT